MASDPGNCRPDASAPIQRTDEHAVERHAAFLRRTSEGPVDLLFLGDSITRRWADVPELWEKYYGKYKAANFGVGSDTTHNMLWRIQNGELENISPRVLVLLIGTNNVPIHTGAEIAAAIRKIVDVSRAGLPRTKILLNAIFPRGPQKRPEGPSGPSPYYMDVVTEANREISKIHDGRTVFFLDCGKAFIGSDGEIAAACMPDQIHLVREGFIVWAESMRPLMEKMMND